MASGLLLLLSIKKICIKKTKRMCYICNNYKRKTLMLLGKVMEGYLDVKNVSENIWDQNSVFWL
jgi:hypothetical protein